MPTINVLKKGKRAFRYRHAPRERACKVESRDPVIIL